MQNFLKQILKVIGFAFKLLQIRKKSLVFDIYAPNSTSKREHLFENLNHILHKYEYQPVILLGDFNPMRDLQIKSIKHFNSPMATKQSPLPNSEHLTDKINSVPGLVRRGKC